MAGNRDSAFAALNIAISLGLSSRNDLLNDTDLSSLKGTPDWDELLARVKETSAATDDPEKARLITPDINNFWIARDLAMADTANRLKIYREHYIDKGSDGLQD